MKKLFRNTAILVIVSAFSASCVDQTYDLSKLNSEVTVFPGLSVPVPEGMKAGASVTVSDLFSIPKNLKTNENNALVEKFGGSVSEEFPASDIELGVKLTSPIRIKPSNNFASFQSKDCDIRFSTLPLSFSMVNPCGMPVSVEAKVTVGGKSKMISFVLTENSEVQEKTIEIADIVNFFPEEIVISDIVLKAVQAKSVNVQKTSGKYSVSISSSLLLPFEFMPGSVLSFSTTLNDLSLDLRELGVNTSHAIIKLLVSSTFPLSFEGKASSGDGKASVTISPVKANTSNQEVTIEAKADKGISTISSVSFTVKASNDTDKVAIISDKAGLDVTVKEITFPNGIDIE